MKNGNRKGWLTVLLLWMTMGTWAADVITEYYKEPFDDPNLHIYTSFYDYSGITRQITSECHNDYERIKAIYAWICANIDYDTTYSIYRADSCFEMRKGVCQAYCELFYQMAKTLDIRVEIIGGMSKDVTGFISGSGHAWLFAYTREKHGIFLDPTWGAGTMEHHQFRRNKNCWTWFNVDPEWLLLTHYPDNPVYQLVDQPISFEEFRNMTVPKNLWKEYGLNTHMLYQLIRDGKLSLPRFYNLGEGQFQIIDIPLQEKLRIGEWYTFRIKMNSDLEFIIMNNKVYCKKKNWTNEGNGVYSVRFMPRDTERLTFGLKDTSVPNYWNNMLEYAIETPEPSDWDKVEAQYPLCVPDAKHVAHVDAEAWEKAGVDGHVILKAIREENIKALPLLHTAEGQQLKIVSVPLNQQLKNGDSYTFSFKPKSGIAWAVVNNNKWYREWQTKDGLYTMTIKPQRGSLNLVVQTKDGGSFWTCLDYNVE